MVQSGVNWCKLVHGNQPSPIGYMNWSFFDGKSNAKFGHAERMHDPGGGLKLLAFLGDRRGEKRSIIFLIRKIY